VSLVRAAGGVVVRAATAGGATEVALVHRPAYDDWSFPKGKLESGEDERDAAIREVAEETGLTCSLEDDLGVVSYVDGHGRPKVVRYWRMSAAPGTEMRPGHEIDRAEWVPLEDAARRLTYPHDRELLTRLTGERPAVEAVPMYLLRHAKAGSRDQWGGSDELRPISPAGRRQSERLVAWFDGRPVHRLFSSRFVRCVQTLEPLAEARGLEIELADELAEGHPLGGVEAFVLAAAADGPSILCTHGDVQQGLVEELLERGARLDDGAVAFKKASAWVLDVLDGKVSALRYVPPPRKERPAAT
jgi:8-oxo-(d)GTP phosphatase